MLEVLACWKCGSSLSDFSKPWSRRATCGQCQADLHVCKLCQFYNPRISDKCNEPQAEHPRETDRANFCDYFTPKAKAHDGDNTKSAVAKTELDALFGKKEP